MNESKILGVFDFFFRLVSTSFRIETSLRSESTLKEQAEREAQSQKPQPHDISSSLLRKYGSDGIVHVLKEFSFPETLSLIRSFNKDARTYVLECLQKHHDLKAALEFGLQYEEDFDSDEITDTSSVNAVHSELCSLFLKRLSAWSDAKHAHRTKAS